MMRKATLFVFVAVATMAIGATSATAGSRAFFGIVQGQPFSSRDYKELGKAGTGTARFGLIWNGVQPTRTGGYRWNAYDAKIGDLAAHGVRAFPTVSGSPSWVAKQPKRPPLDSKADKQAWRDFLSAAVKRYGPGGTYWRTTYLTQHPGKRKLPISDWQIWNEPNLRKFFPKKHATRNYATLVKLSAEPIRQADPKAEVVLAGMPAFLHPTADQFLGRLYRVKGFKKSFDAAALHPYAETMKKFVTSIKRLRSTLKRHHDKQKGLWLTEVGWGSKGHHGHLNKGKQGQMRMLKRSFSVSLHKRRKWHIEGVQWFDWRDPAKGESATCSFCSSAGLLKHDYGKKPAYRAFKHFATRH
jgi:polysaccharide biosynthesis protein PslG